MASTGRREEEAVRAGHPPSGRLPPQNTKKRAVSSKYDVHKVKVWLGDKRDHYYILSRFLISRSLTITKIPSTKAIKIALELKKHLVDHDKLNVSQDELEETLFGLMRAKGYGQAYIDCYRTVSEFYQLRQPLVIIVCGAPCTGKSTIAQQLAARLNMPNVMQTDVICELMRRATGGALPSQPPWARKLERGATAPRANSGTATGVVADESAAGRAGSEPDNGGAPWYDKPYRHCAGPPVQGGGDEQPGATSGGAGGDGSRTPASPRSPRDDGAGGGGGSGSGDLRREDSSSLDSWVLSEFRSECRVVRRALQGDFNKALNDGKPLIVEGVHLDPGQLLGELQELGIVILPVDPAPATPLSSQRSDQRSPPPQLQLLGAMGSAAIAAAFAADADGAVSGRCSSPVPRPSFSSPPAHRGGGGGGGSPLSRETSPLGNSGSGEMGVVHRRKPGEAESGALSTHGSGAASDVTTAASGEEGLVAPQARQPQPQPHAHSRLYQKHVSWGRLHGDSHEEASEGEDVRTEERGGGGAGGGGGGGGAGCGPGGAVRAGSRNGLQFSAAHGHVPDPRQQRPEAPDGGGDDDRGGGGGSGGGGGGCGRSISEGSQAGEAAGAGCGGLDRLAHEEDGGSDGGGGSGGGGGDGGRGGGEGVDDAASWLGIGEDEGGERGSPERSRWASSSHADSSARNSCSNFLDDGCSDVNNYGDADTDGGASGKTSPVQIPAPSPPPPPPASLRDAAGPAMRRAQSHAVMARTVEDDVVEEEEVKEGELGGGCDGGDGSSSAGEAAGGGAGFPQRRSSMTDAILRGVPRMPSITSPGNARTAGGAAGGGGGGARVLDRTRSHQTLLSAGGSFRVTQLQQQLQQQSSTAFARNGSLSAMDMHVFKSSLAGILRMGSAVHGARLSPSPRPTRDNMPGRTGSSCGPTPSTGATTRAGGSPSTLARAFSAGRQANSGGNGSGSGNINQQRQQLQQQSQRPQDRPPPQQQEAWADAAVGPASSAPGAEAAAEDEGATAAEGCGTPLPPPRAKGRAPGAEEGAEVVFSTPHQRVPAAAPAAAFSDGGAGAGGGGGAGAGGGGTALPPLFVPVVLRMSEPDHRLALEDNTAVHGGGGGGESARATGTGECTFKGPEQEDLELEEVLQRSQAIQQYLCSFEAQGMPVIDVKYGNFGAALDVLHEYVLLCIQAAMEQLCDNKACECEVVAAVPQ